MTKTEGLVAPVLNMQFEKHGRLYFQRARRKHASGDASWHCRTKQLRKMHHEVYAAGGLRELAARIANVLGTEVDCG